MISKQDVKTLAEADDQEVVREVQVCPKINLVQQKFLEGKIVNIFLLIIFSICFGCSNESSH